MTLGIHFDSCGSLRDHFPGLLVSLGIQVELGKEGLDITLLLDGHKASLEFLGGVHILVDISLA